MKIIHIITAFGIGGAEKLLLNVINKQAEDNSVYLIYFKNKNDLIVQLDRRIIVKQIPFSLSVVKKLENYYKEINPHIIHTHLGHADFLGIWSARKIKVKLFCTMHNIYFKKNFLDTFFFKLYPFLFSKTTNKVHVISISKSVENHVLETLKLPKERSHLLVNAIPSIKFVEEITKNKVVQLLFLGRLEKQKSIKTLLKSVKLLQSEKLDKAFHLRIVGDGKLKKDLEELTKKLKIEDLVSFEGEKNNVNTYYKASDLFILPSIWEGFGIVILEAFRSKIAVIASNIEGPSELIEHDKNGLLFEPGNWIELAGKIKELINNELKMRNLANNGYLTFTEKYHIDTYVTKLNTLYKNV